ncbi:unnamed protein product [Caenorhabditis bovis]|uniref:Uncharacterized protein n=1 Tax=Caenorhabditis bovis TaxID=2654633 RepID=A0A8S1EM44_9PELO|nr:unnamed protein product [Caenorhabditis bovis]
MTEPSICMRLRDVLERPRERKLSNFLCYILFLASLFIAAAFCFKLALDDLEEFEVELKEISVMFQQIISLFKNVARNRACKIVSLIICLMIACAMIFLSFALGLYGFKFKPGFLPGLNEENIDVFNEALKTVIPFISIAMFVGGVALAFWTIFVIGALCQKPPSSTTARVSCKNILFDIVITEIIES